MHPVKAVLVIVSFFILAFVGYLLFSWFGVIGGIVLWLIGAGSMGITKDIETIAKKK